MRHILENDGKRIIISQDVKDWLDDHDLEIDSGGTFYMLRHIKYKYIGEIEPDSLSISWSVEDFARQAECLEGEDWERVYDKTKFFDALSNMIENHDATLGINWETVTVYLDEYCLRDDG